VGEVTTKPQQVGIPIGTENTATFGVSPKINSIGSPGSGLNVASLPTPSPGNSSGIMDEVKGTEGVDFKTCDNCRRKIPIASYNMHIMSCARMNYFCTSCNVAVLKARKEEHNKTTHEIVTCECGAPMEIQFFNDHKLNDCPNRMVDCLYCENTLPFHKRAEHESKCGDLTDLCAVCSLRIQRRVKVSHVGVCKKPEPTSFYKDTYIPMDKKPTPAYSSKIFKKQEEELFFCEKCTTPFRLFDELEVHMLTEHFEDNQKEQNEEVIIENTEKPAAAPTEEVSANITHEDNMDTASI